LNFAITARLCFFKSEMNSAFQGSSTWVEQSPELIPQLAAVVNVLAE
jgi:hypothetical protein